MCFIRARNYFTQSFSKLDGERLNPKESISNFDQIHVIINDIASNLSEIMKQNYDAGQSVLSLSESSNSIKQFVSQI